MKLKSDLKRAICIIDTSSIINLDGVKVGPHEILALIRKYLRVCSTDEIIREIKKHLDKVSEHETKRTWPCFLAAMKLKPKTLIADEIVKVFFTQQPKLFGGKNCGERANACLAMELLLNRKAGKIIFISDDENAKNGFLSCLCEAFPGIHLWTSSDVVFFWGGILLKERETTFDALYDAIWDVRANSGKGGTSGLIKTINRDKRNLQKLKSITDCWS